MSANVLGVIPARYDSSRLPGKPLADICGRPMIQWVYERVIKILPTTMVATDDIRIFKAVEGFGGTVVMTSHDHISGTLRVAEVAELYPGYDYFLNIQGDQPLISLKIVQDSVDFLRSLDPKEIAVTTLVTELSENAINDDTIAKVVLDKNNDAIYFSRSPIPHCRDRVLYNPYAQHVGTYGFTRPTLDIIKNLPMSYLEETEKLEQLTWLFNKITIRTTNCNDSEKFSVDTQKDLDKARAIMRGMIDAKNS